MHLETVYLSDKENASESFPKEDKNPNPKTKQMKINKN